MKKLLMFLLVLIQILSLKSQNIYHPWCLSVSANYTDFHVVNRKFEDFLLKADWMGKNAPTMMSFGRLLNPSFAISGVFSSVTIENSKLNQIPLQDSIENDFFWRTGIQIEYKFANGYLLPHKFWFDPYLLLGANISNFDNKSYFAQFFGFGSNLWITDYFGVNFQASYDHLPDFNSYMHYSVGIITRLGKMADKDSDRVPNLVDKCPDIFGVEYLKGCPDFDGDGIVDSLDRCPQEYGKIGFKGCPDRDNDGIPDIDDDCPDLKGSKKYNGCDENLLEYHSQKTLEDSVFNPDKKSKDELTTVAEPNTPPPSDVRKAFIENTSEILISSDEFKNTTKDKYCIITGSFEILDNAKKFAVSLKSKGFEPELIGQTQNGPFRVTIGSYSSKEEAKEVLQKYRKEFDQKAWILKN